MDCVYVYSRQGCHLCEDLIEDLLPLIDGKLALEIRDIDTNASNRGIVEAIIAMANTCGLRVLAEGVETEQELATLRRLGCDEIQGYMFSEPVSSNAHGPRVCTTPSCGRKMKRFCPMLSSRSGSYLPNGNITPTAAPTTVLVGCAL